MSVETYTRAKDGATVYCAVYYGPDGRRRKRKVRVVPKDAAKRDHERAETAALKSAQDNRVDVENGEWKDPKTDRPRRFMFTKLVERFLKNYSSRTGSVDYYKQRLATPLIAFATKTADELTPQDVDQFRKDRAAEVSSTTVRQDLVALSSMFRWAMARKLVASNPADPMLVKRPPKGRPDPHPLTAGESVLLLDALPDYLRPVVEFALETGADRGELIAMNWRRHVDRDRKLIRLPRAKTGVDRTLPYDQNAALKRLLQDAGKVVDVSGTVFLRDGKPIDLQAAKTAMRRAWKKAGIPKPKPWKSLRATFASRKAEAGVDVPTIAALMGLTTSHVLEHYIKPSGAHLAGAMADGPGVVGGTPPAAAEDTLPLARQPCSA